MQNITIEILDRINHVDDEYERAHWAYLDGFAAYQQGSIGKDELRKLYQARLEALKKSQDYFNQNFILKEAS
jgi:hypothetical protein